MFWLIVLITTMTLFVAYTALSRYGVRWGVSAYRLRLLRRSSWLLLAWAGVALANVLEHRH